MKKLKGDHLMMSWHDTQNQPEIGFDGQNIIIKITLDKPVHGMDKVIDNIDTITEFIDRCVIIKIRKERVEQNNGDIYKTVRSCWRNDINRAKQVDFVLAVIDGIVRGVYEPIEWYYSYSEKCESEKPQCEKIKYCRRKSRIAFNGRLVTDNDINKHYLNKYIPEEYRRQGMAAPVLFI